MNGIDDDHFQNLNAVGASGYFEPPIVVCCKPKFIVSFSVCLALKVVVVLMVNLALVEGELGRVVHPHGLFSQGVSVVALAFHQFESSVFRGFFDGWVARVADATGKTDQTSVFGTTVHGIHAIYYWVLLLYLYHFISFDSIRFDSIRFEFDEQLENSIMSHIEFEPNTNTSRRGKAIQHVQTICNIPIHCDRLSTTHLSSWGCTKKSRDPKNQQSCFAGWSCQRLLRARVFHSPQLLESCGNKRVPLCPPIFLPRIPQQMCIGSVLGLAFPFLLE